ncbi:MAG: EAL domain-containing protein [Flexilinea sp.]|nr:EAL domain-containing protein [Flexilinea sp.]
MIIFSEDNRKFFEAMTIPLAYFGKEDGKIKAILVSDGLCEMMKTGRDALIDSLNFGMFDRIHPDDSVRITRIVREFAQHLCGYDVIYRAKYAQDDDYHYVHSIGRFQHTDDGSDLALFVYTDVSESESASRMLVDNYKMFQKDHFYSDSVTDLPNLNFLLEFSDDILTKIRGNGHTYALTYFDVIGLRYYNNQYGFSRGDELLRQISDILKSEYPDAYLCRGEDDHFILIAEHLDEEHTKEKIISINEKIRVGAYGNASGVQSGICIIEPDMDIPGAMDHAKHALKLIGDDLNKTHIYYTREAGEDYWDQRYILESFNMALENEWIKIYYQAIMRIKTGKAAALEALARWVDPLRGIIMPAVFIPVLDKYHMLYKLDLYMVEQVCKEIPERKKLGLPIIPISVNFSAQDFDHVNVVESLNELFARYRVKKSDVIIEITEQDIARGTEHFREQIHELRKNGFFVWIDDFGSGYSSLNIFSQLHIDLTKFDIEFLRHLDDNNGANRYIMKAMIDVAKKIGIRTLAEGVETEEQLEFLREIGCDFAQGFYYYKPQSLGAIAFKLQKGSPFILCETPEERKQYLNDGDTRFLPEQSDMIRTK